MPGVPSHSPACRRSLAREWPCCAACTQAPPTPSSPPSRAGLLSPSRAAHTGAPAPLLCSLSSARAGLLHPSAAPAGRASPPPLPSSPVLTALLCPAPAPVPLPRSYFAVGNPRNITSVLAEPFGRLLFAGEATSEKPATGEMPSLPAAAADGCAASQLVQLELVWRLGQSFAWRLGQSLFGGKHSAAMACRRSSSMLEPHCHPSLPHPMHSAGCVPVRPA